MKPENRRLFARLHKLSKDLPTLEKSQIYAGWFAWGKPKTGLSKPMLARILSEGAHLNGGQPYMMTKEGLIFLKKTSTMGQRALKAAQGGRGGTTRPKTERKGFILGLGVTKPCDIPPRPMLKYAADKYGKNWAQYGGNLAVLVVEKGLNPEHALNQLGGRIQADIKAAMLHGAYTPNSELTAKAKGRNTPLIGATHDLVNSVQYVLAGGK